MSSHALLRRSEARLLEGPAPEVLGRMRALHADGRTLYASCGLDLYVSHDGGASFRHVARAWRSRRERALAVAPVAARFLRAGIHHLTPLPGGGAVAIVRGAVIHLAPGESSFQVAHRVLRGTRPLNACLAPDGRLHFGEYFGNPERREVHVYGSDDGRQWDVAYTFPAGEIRHVHAIQYDAQRRCHWIMSGDEGREAGIWCSADGFRTVEPVVRGVQGARAVSILSTPDGLIVPSDTPSEENFVQRLDVESGRLERLAPLPGSVFSTGRTESLYLLSTAIESSTVNLDRRVALFASRDGHDWRAVARFGRDLAFLRDMRGYLQYPMLLLPGGVQAAGSVLATAQALDGLHGRLLRWTDDSVFSGDGA